MSGVSELPSFGSPAGDAAPSAVASLLGHGITTGLAERMLLNPRLRQNLEAALAERLGPCPTELSPAQAHLAFLDSRSLTRLALRAGAVWHAARIAQAYEGPTVRALIEHIGSEFRELALADLVTYPEARPVAPAPELKVADLPAAIARDGTACLVAWCEAQPRPVGWRVLLKIRFSARPAPCHVVSGPAIIDRLTTAALA